MSLSIAASKISAGRLGLAQVGPPGGRPLTESLCLPRAAIERWQNYGMFSTPQTYRTVQFGRGLASLDWSWLTGPVTFLAICMLYNVYNLNLHLTVYSNCTGTVQISWTTTSDWRLIVHAARSLDCNVCWLVSGYKYNTGTMSIPWYDRPLMHV